MSGYGHVVDALRLGWRHPSSATIASWPSDTNLIDTDAGKIRVRDTGGAGPALVMVPDGPCVIEHYEVLIAALTPQFRVVCFDMPGFGFSYPRMRYDFGLEKGSDVVIAVLDALAIERATLSFSCANGFYAIAAVKKRPDRISRLILAQTPSQDAMRQWVECNIPKPIRIPFVGQATGMAMTRKLASNWFHRALPRKSPSKELFQSQAISAIRAGGCFCLASTVQGLLKSGDNKLSNTDIPVTMVWGNRDHSHRSTNFESLREDIPQCEFREFDGCGHFPNLEKPQAFVQLFRETEKVA